MARESIVHSLTRSAGVDLLTHKYRCVKFSGGNLVKAGDGDAVVGVLQNKADVGEEAVYAREGKTKGEAGSAIAEGDIVASDANGKFKTAGSGDHPVGTAATAATADGSIFEVELNITLTPQA